MALRFARLPTWWARVDGLLLFPAGGRTGESLAGMKCLLALSLTLDFHTLESGASISKIESLTGLSRPMVIKGLKYLEASNLIEITRGAHSNAYKVIESCKGGSGWAKVPYAVVLRELKELQNRGVVALMTLKVYVALLASRPNFANTTALTYDAIVARTNGQRSDVRRALDILVIRRLIRCAKAEETHAPNVYTLIGIEA